MLKVVVGTALVASLISIAGLDPHTTPASNSGLDQPSAEIVSTSLAFIPVSDALMPIRSCNAECQVGAEATPACGTGRHRAPAWPGSAFENGHGLHTPCQPKTCTEGDEPAHPACDEEDEQELQLALEEFLQAPSATSLRELSGFDHHVFVNRGRGAIQFLRCNGEVEFHLPVDAQLLAESF